MSNELDKSQAEKLAQLQAEAIALAHQTAASIRQTVVSAARTGAKLIEIKKDMSPGEFASWIEDNMPVKRAQCGRYMSLAKGRPELLAECSPDNILDLLSEVKLLTLDDEDQAEEVRELADKEKLNRAEIKDLVDQLKKSELTIEEWRQQFLDERTEKREAKEEAETAQSETEETVKAKVAEQLQAHRDEVERLQAQETSLTSSIETLTDQWNELDNTVGVRKDQAVARKEYKDLLEHMAIKAGVLWDGDSSTDDKAAWLKLFNDTEAMLATFRGLLDKPIEEDDMFT